jgi:hypothetical protein
MIRVIPIEDVRAYRAEELEVAINDAISRAGGGRCVGVMPAMTSYFATCPERHETTMAYVFVEQKGR